MTYISNRSVEPFKAYDITPSISGCVRQCLCLDYSILNIDILLPLILPYLYPICNDFMMHVRHGSDDHYLFKILMSLLPLVGVQVVTLLYLVGVQVVTLLHLVGVQVVTLLYLVGDHVFTFLLLMGDIILLYYLLWILCFVVCCFVIMIQNSILYFIFYIYNRLNKIRKYDVGGLQQRLS